MSQTQREADVKFLRALADRGTNNAKCVLLRAIAELEKEPLGVSISEGPPPPVPPKDD